MTSVRVTINEDFDGLQETLNRYVIPAALNAMAVTIQGAAKQMLNRKIGPSAPGQPPGKRTGRLEASVAVQEAKPGQLVARTGTGVEYGAVLERGATIRSKGKKLTVPLTPKAEKLRRQNKSLRSIKGLSLRPTKDPNEFLLVNKDGSIKFLLVDSVNVKKRPWLGPAFKKNREKAVDNGTKVAARVLAQRYKGVA